MAVSIYKKGQGYYTRVYTAIGYALLVLWGAYWLTRQMDVLDMGVAQTYVQAGAAVLFISFFSYIGYLFIGRRKRSVDFLVATEAEMKKVNWSTRREVTGSTFIVIVISFFIALLCWLFDNVFAWFFATIDVLEPTL
ncbi:MAG: preprotein translocase subunit SecE [Planctomycetota bacterium]|nr:preprotein translocase subunit SecE [Planctomycetota bacterium]MEC8559505.1 preprotein translocase subunit SecE [Planctomycetota bacterium]MEC8817924.1 preprotein translocase subunit SecE [Planctomycetota bacterium]MEC9157167.1 preprotein translocase subunit SecE [Planctomycetota bacterium]MED5507542.1 preprotein translocase subunit SecE [Planctomycetota bacterium]